MNEPLDVELLVGRYAPMVISVAGSSSGTRTKPWTPAGCVVRLLERRGRLDASHPSSLLYITATNICLKPHPRPGPACGTCRRRRARTDRGGRGTPAGESDAGWCSTGCSAAAGFEPHDGVLHYLDGLTLEE